MKSPSASRFMTGMLLVALSLAAVVIVWATNRQKNINTDRFRMENKTRSLAVESVENSREVQGRSQFAVTVRNGYDKPIVAYSIRVEDGSTDKDTISAVERGGLVDDWSLPPNATDIAHVSASSEGNIVLTIFAVMFEDGTGDGDTDDLMRLQEVRAGVKLAYQRIAPILRRAANETNAVGSDEATQSLEGEVASINDKEVPMNLRRGFAQAKAYIGSELKELKDKVRSKPSLKYGEEVNKKAKELEKALAKL
jgi:uncharacterized protein (UPF0147 family)